MVGGGAIEGTADVVGDAAVVVGLTRGVVAVAAGVARSGVGGAT